MTEARDLAIEFKGKHDQISARMRAHASGKLAKLQRYNDRIDRIEVVADHAHENPEVELIVHMRRGAPLVARERGQTFANTVDLLIVKMEKQLKRQKEKRKDHRPAGGQRPAGKRTAGRESGEETYEQIVRRDLKS